MGFVPFFVSAILNNSDSSSQLSIVWTIDDVKEVATQKGLSLTEDECVLVLESLDNNFDANVGINWDTIDFAIDSFLDS